MNSGTPDEPTRSAEEAAAAADAQAEIAAEEQAERDAEMAAEAVEERDTVENAEDEDDRSPEEKLTDENAELRDQLLRTVADMENLRKRTEKEKRDARTFAIQKFAEDLLSVSDTMERAISAVPAEARESDEQTRSIIEGVELVSKSLANIMERHGVKIIEAAGTKFDPNLHQAVMETEDHSLAKGFIIDVAATGYMIGDRVLRPAMVVVSKGPGSAAAAPTEKTIGKDGRPILSLSEKSDLSADQDGADQDGAGPDTPDPASSVNANDNPDPETSNDPA